VLEIFGDSTGARIHRITGCIPLKRVEDQLRIDEVQRAIGDFTSRVFGTSGGLMTS